MRNFVVGALGLLLPGALWAQPTGTVVVGREIVRDTTIFVSASRVTRIAPDRVTFYAVVEGTAETGADASARADTKLKGVMDVLAKQGSSVTAEKPIFFGVANAQPQGYPPSGVAMQTARIVVRVHLTQLDRLSGLVAALQGAGASNVLAYQFDGSQQDAQRRAKYTEVLSVVRQDAEAIAAALGGRIAGVVDVSANASVSGNPFGTTQLNLDARFSGGPTIAPEVTVTTNVSVRFKVTR